MNVLKLSVAIIALMNLQLSMAQPGSPDGDFGKDGKVTTDFNSQNDQGKTLAVQSDNRIIVAGITHNGTDKDFALVRYMPDGSLDLTFGKNGRVVTDIQNNDYARCLLVQNDGRILVGGYVFTLLKYHMVLVRYNSDGTLDHSFGNKGIVISNFGGEDQCRSLAIQPDGKILAAGYTERGNKDMALFRYTHTGIPDTTFGRFGRVITEISDFDELANSVLVLEDERIIVAGSYDNGTDWDIGLARYKANGDLDTHFGKSGITKTRLGSLNDRVSTVTVQRDGNILVAGSTDTPSGNDVAILRYNSEGIRDISFGSRGAQIIAVSKGNEYCRDLVLQADGKMLLTGLADNGSDNDCFLLRCDSDGNPDESFGDGGLVCTSFGNWNDCGESIALQGDGRIVVAGYYSNGTDNDFVLARYFSGLETRTTEYSDLDFPVKLYPNPIHGDHFWLDYEIDTEGWTSISLFDSLGKLRQVLVSEIWKIPGNHRERLVLDPSLPQGAYYLAICHSGSRRSFPVIIQK